MASDECRHGEADSSCCPVCLQEKVQERTRERNEARESARQLHRRVQELEKANREACCAFCGQRLDEDAHWLGEARTNSLADHIRTCPKHPMREMERKLYTLTFGLREVVSNAKRGDLYGAQASAETALEMIGESS